MQSRFNRRTFIKSAAAVTALAVPASAADGRMYVTMRTLNGFWVAGAPAWNVEWRELAAIAAKAGYAGVDTLPFASMVRDGPDQVRARLSELNLRVGFLGCPVNPGVPEEGVFKTALSRLEEACAFAAAIGCPRLITTVLSSSDIPKEEWRKIVLDRMHTMAPILEKHKVRVGVENLAPLHFRKRLKFEFLYTVPEIVALCKDGGPSFGLCLDAWHWHHSGGTVKDILDAGRSQVVMVHLDDARKQPANQVQDSQRLMPGEGAINLTGFLRALQQIGYAGNVSPEPLGRFPIGTSAEDVARKTLEATRAVMQKAGVAMA